MRWITWICRSSVRARRTTCPAERKSACPSRTFWRWRARSFCWTNRRLHSIQQGEERLERVLDRLSDEGRTLLISTHDVDFAFRWATRAVVFSAGRILADDTPQAVFGDAALLRQAHLRRRCWRRCLQRCARGGWCRPMLPARQQSWRSNVCWVKSNHAPCGAMTRML